jgi:hypothetical protein
LEKVVDNAQVIEKLAGIDHRLESLEKGQERLATLVSQALAGQGTGRRAAPPPPPDGPVAPDKFRLNNKLYQGFSPLEWKLLRRLWGRSAVSIGKLMDDLYGHDHSQTDGALYTVKKRLSGKLLNQNFPGEIVAKNGFLSLELASAKPGQKKDEPGP